MNRNALVVLAIGLACARGVSVAKPNPPDAPSDHLVFKDGDGGFREKPKTTMLDGTPKVYATVKDYIAALPLTDDQILKQFPSVKKTSTDRLTSEKQVVRVHAKLYAVRLETDNDFHCILGDGENGPYITAEVSALPAHGNTDAFVTVRRQLRELVGPAGMKTAMTKYFRPSSGISVRVTGSRFYDAEHKPGTIGPTASAGKPARKAQTQWEIHPVHSMEADPSH